jgi:hypothetical protein
MLELIGTAAPAPVNKPSATANGLAVRVETGLDFAQMLRQAEKQEAPPDKPKAIDEPPERDGAAAEAAVAKDDARDDAIERVEEDELTEAVPTAREQTDAVVAVAMEADVAPELEQADEEVDGEEAAIVPVRLSEVEGDEEALLETDIEGEGDEEAVVLVAVPVAEADAGSPLELLNFSELMDPDLMVEKAPDQLIARITQAANSAASPLQEELAETVMPQVIRNLATLVREGGAEMRLQLKPADLGEIELRVRTAGGVVRGEMMVQHPEIKQLLEDQVGRLKSELAAQGLVLEGFDVNVNRDPRFGQGSDQAGQGENRRDTGLAGGVGSTGDTNAGQEAPVAVSIDNHEVDFTT